jgi:hypothetical protein
MNGKPDAGAETAELVRYRLDFAQRCFSNVQELTRFIDQKAFYLPSPCSP